jgi:hypothetical protein
MQDIRMATTCIQQLGTSSQQLITFLPIDPACVTGASPSLSFTRESQPSHQTPMFATARIGFYRIASLQTWHFTFSAIWLSRGMADQGFRDLDGEKWVRIGRCVRLP